MKFYYKRKGNIYIYGNLNDSNYIQGTIVAGEIGPHLNKINYGKYGWWFIPELIEIDIEKIPVNIKLEIFRNL